MSGFRVVRDEVGHCDYDEVVTITKTFIGSTGSIWVPYSEKYLNYKLRQQTVLTQRFGSLETSSLKVDGTLLMLYLRILYKREMNVLKEGIVLRLHDRTTIRRYLALSPQARLIRMAVLQTQIELNGIYVDEVHKNPSRVKVTLYEDRIN